VLKIFRFSRNNASIQEIGTIRRAIGGASVILWNSYLQLGNSCFISSGRTPRVCGLVGLSQKSYQRIMPLGFPDAGSGLRSTRSSSAQILRRISGSRMEEMAVYCRTRSKILDEYGRDCPSALAKPELGNVRWAWHKRSKSRSTPKRFLGDAPKPKYSVKTPPPPQPISNIRKLEKSVMPFFFSMLRVTR